MTLHTKIYLAIAAVCLLGGGVGAKEFLAEHDARIRAESTVEAQKTLQQQYRQQVSDLAKQMAERDAAYQSSLKQLDARFQRATTPDQLAQLLNTLGALPEQIRAVQSTPTAQNPNPAPHLEIPSLDLPQAKAYIQDCETCKLNLAKATADAADRDTQAHLAQLQIDSLKKENTSLQVALKGGTWFSRVKKAGKYIFWGAVGGAAAICISGHCR